MGEDSGDGNDGDSERTASGRRRKRDSIGSDRRKSPILERERPTALGFMFLTKLQKKVFICRILDSVRLKRLWFNFG